MNSRKKKKIFIDALPIVSNRVSGIGHTIVETIRALESQPGIKEKYDIVLLVPFTKKNSMSQWGFQYAKEKTFPFPGRFMSKAETFHILPPLDLIFGKGTYLFMNFKNWPLTRLSKSITYIHDICYAIYPQYVQPKNQQYLYKNVPRWLKRADVVVTVSNTSALEIAAEYDLPSAKLSVIYNGLDHSEFYPRSKSEISAVKKKFNIIGPYIFFLSNIEPRKNLDVLISAVEKLNKQNKVITLLIVGGMGWLNDAIFEHIEEAVGEGCKIVVPSQYVPDEDLPKLLSGATMLVHPAFHEGFGISPLQAMACGTPVIAADIPVLHETLEDAGIYFDPKDNNDLVDKMILILDNVDLVKKMKVSGRKRAASFTWQETARQLTSLL